MSFPNGKKYVGVTEDFKRRIYQYRCAAKTNKYSSLVHKAIRKYGEDKTNVKILGRFYKYEDALNFEKELIKQFDTREFGYNLTDGGQGQSGYKRSPVTLETKLKLSLANRGRIVLSRRGVLVDQFVRDQISKTLGSKEVEVFKKDGAFIGSWINLNKCSQDLDLYRGNITHCLKGKLKSTGGYIFKYKETL